MLVWARGFTGEYYSDSPENCWTEVASVAKSTGALLMLSAGPPVPIGMAAYGTLGTRFDRRFRLILLSYSAATTSDR